MAKLSLGGKAFCRLDAFVSAAMVLAVLAPLQTTELTGTLDPAQGVVHVGKLRIGVGPPASMLPQLYRDRDGRPPFAIDSFHEVLSGKIVLIGATAALKTTGVNPRDAGSTPLQWPVGGELEPS